MTQTLRVKDKIDWKEIFNLKNLLLVVIGTALVILAMKGFMVPNRFMDGGITGISILLQEILGINISILVVVLNAIFIYMGYKRIGKTFAVQTTFAVILLSLGLYFVQLEPITTDRLLTAIFGGILIGSGVGLVIRSGGVVDGLEVVAAYTEKKTSFSNSEIILLFNSIIFLMAAFYFGIETAMYTFITYFTANKATDYIVDGIEEFTAMNIVSTNHEAVKELIVKEFGKAITVYKGERGYLPGKERKKSECEIIVTILTRLEIKNLEQAIRMIDPQAFIYTSSINETSGGVVRRKNS